MHKIANEKIGSGKNNEKIYNYGKLISCRMLEKPHFSVKKKIKKTADFVDNYPPFWWITWITLRK